MQDTAGEARVVAHALEVVLGVVADLMSNVSHDSTSRGDDVEVATLMVVVVIYRPHLRTDCLASRSLCTLDALSLLIQLIVAKGHHHHHHHHQTVCLVTIDCPMFSSGK